MNQKILSRYLGLVNIGLILLLLFSMCYGKVKVGLKDVNFLRVPVDMLVFEFDNKPEYKVFVEKEKIKFNFYNVVPIRSEWIKKLPKEVIKEIDVSLVKDGLLIEFTLTKKFNVNIKDLENKVIVEFIWDSGLKPVNVIVKEKQIETLEQKTIREILQAIESKVMYPSYEIYLGEKKIQMPLTQKEYRGLPISVDLQEADIHAVFRLIAEVGNINIVVSDKVKGNITLKAKNVPWDLLLDAVVSNFGLAKLHIGNMVIVATLEEIKKYAELYKDYLRAIAQGKEGIKTEIEVQRDIMDALQKLQEEKNVLITKTFRLKYLRASKVIDVMKNQRISEKLQELLKDPNKVTFEPLTNTLIVKATPKILDEIETIIKEIDRPRPQILIEARMVEIEDSYVYGLGIRWGGAVSKPTEKSIWGVSPNPSSSLPSIRYPYPQGAGPSGGNSTVNLPSSAIFDLGIGAATSNLGILLGYFGDTLAVLDITLSALEKSGIGRIISRPSILTLDRETATIQQGYKIPYLSYAANIQQATVSFIDAGLKFEVTPSLTPEGKLLLDIVVERSYPDWSHTVAGEPTIVTNVVKTSALVENGETLVIGGIKTREIIDNLDKVPGLSQIPGAGELFKKREKSMKNAELLVFLTPRIIDFPIAGIDY